MKILKPNRVAHTYVQTIKGRPEQIFPLYCPVQETLWCEGWDPVAVYSDSGVNEPDCVFVTEDDGVASVWYVTVLDRDKGLVEMIKHTPGKTISKLNISIRPITAETTRAEITYGFTSLGTAGDLFLKGFTQETFETAMDAWEQAMNHYLAKGEMLTGLPAF